MRRERYFARVYKKARYNGGFLGNNSEYGVGGMWGLYSVFSQSKYAISPRSTSVNEGSTLVFDIATTNVRTGTVLYWTLNKPSDFSVSSGSFIISNNAGTVSVSPRADVTGEGSETFTVSIRTTSISGPIRATSPNITINDTSIAPIIGQQQYTSAGTYTWVAPAGVTSVCVVCVGGGGSGNGLLAGGGGGLGWRNNITVVPGNSYTVRVGAAGLRAAGSSVGKSGGDSYFVNVSGTYAAGRGGGSGGSSGTSGSSAGGGYVGQGGGTGGAGGTYTGGYPGGGGAAGYAGNGGRGGNNYRNGSAGAGGGGGGGASGGGSGGGGGVGIFGQGANGVGGVNTNRAGWPESGAGGGSGGNTGSRYRNGGSYGGGSGSAAVVNTGVGAGGAVRIIWGPNRAFPSSSTGNQ